MNVSIVVIGDELLLGRVADTNSGFIARTVNPAGWQVTSVEIVGDNADDILAAITRAMERSEIVFTTGGLGPTKDDITKATLCQYFGGGVHLDEEVLRNVEDVMQRRGRELNELTRTQAVVPNACTVIQNRVGTAPIMMFERDGHTLVSLPGVPFETEQMFTSAVFPLLLERHGRDMAIAHRSLIVTDYSESALAEKIADIEATLPTGLHLAYLPSQGYVHLRLDGFGRDAEQLSADIDRHRDLLAERLGDAVICREDIPTAQILLRRLDELSLTVATAESCTGGNIAHRITLIPGSSSAMMGGVVAYSNEVKMAVLGVEAATLDNYGAVSEPVVAQMAEGVRRACHADVGIATSGIAGPGGAVPGKPVGTVCIGVSSPRGTVTMTRHFPGNRERVIGHATTIALIAAIKQLSAQ